MKICELVTGSKFNEAVNRFLYKNAKNQTTLRDENLHREYMNIFEEYIEVGLLQKFSYAQIISFYCTFSDNVKEYNNLNAAVCQTVESFLSIEQLEKTLIDFRSFD